VPDGSFPAARFRHGKARSTSERRRLDGLPRNLGQAAVMPPSVLLRRLHRPRRGDHMGRFGPDEAMAAEAERVLEAYDIPTS
jgi:hypothetical protein